MFVDDDVVLGRGCVASLLQTLQARVEFAAFAADYNHEMKAGRGNSDYPPHVGMGATLFRRKPLESVTFRWEDQKCECQCCCDDLRRAGYGIGYLPGAVAWHKPDSSKQLQGPNANERPKRAKTPIRPVVFSPLSTVITFRSFTGSFSERCGPLVMANK